MEDIRKGVDSSYRRNSEDVMIDLETLLRWLLAQQQQPHTYQQDGYERLFLPQGTKTWSDANSYTPDQLMWNKHPGLMEQFERNRLTLPNLIKRQRQM